MYEDAGCEEGEEREERAKNLEDVIATLGMASLTVSDLSGGLAADGRESLVGIDNQLSTLDDSLSRGLLECRDDVERMRKKVDDMLADAEAALRSAKASFSSELSDEQRGR